MKLDKLLRYRNVPYMDDIRIIDSILCRLNENDLIIYLDNLKNDIPKILIDNIKNNKQKGSSLLSNFLKNKHGYIQIPISNEYKDDITIKIYFDNLYQNIYDDIIDIFTKYLFNNNLYPDGKTYQVNITSIGIEYIFTTKEYNILKDLYSLYYYDICNRRSSIVKIISEYDNLNTDELIKIAEELSSKK